MTLRYPEDLEGCLGEQHSGFSCISDLRLSLAVSSRGVKHRGVYLWLEGQYWLQNFVQSVSNSVSAEGTLGRSKHVFEGI